MPDTIIVVQPAQQTVLSINSNPTSGLVIGVVGPAGPQGPEGASGTGGTGSGSTDISGLVPYVGATSNLNMTAFSITARSISSGGGITGTTISAVTLLAGNFQSVTSNHETRISGVEAATGNLNSHLTGTDSGTASLQTQSGSLWNSKVPYTGASASVNLTAFSVTAGSISSGGGLTGTTVSAITLLAGNFQTVTAFQDSRLTGLESGTGILQTQVSSLWNSKVPYTGASADVNLAARSLTSATISGLTISADSVSSQTLSAGNIRVANLVFGDGSIQSVASTGGTGEANTGANLLTIGSGTAGLFAQKVGVILQFKDIIAGANIGITESTSAITISGQTSGGSGGGLPYPTGATAGVNLQTFGLTAISISSGGGVTGITISAVTLLAGNFQAVTASQESRLIGLESGTGTIQTQIGSLWNAKIPYTGASASVNLATNSLTAATLSALTITASTVSASTISAGTIVGTSISSSTISAGTMTALGMSAIDVRFQTAVINSGTFISLSNSFGSATFVSLSGVGTVLGGSFQTAGSVSAGTVSANRAQAVSVSSFTISSGTAATSQIAFADGTTMITAPPASQGEANTLTSYGAGVALTAGKVGVALGLFGLSAGVNIGLTRSESLSSVTISAAAGGGSFTGGAIASAYWVGLYNDQDPAPTITVNFGTSNVQHITVSAATTATLIGGSAGGRYALLVDQGSTTGSLLLSGSPSAIKWANGIAPGFSTQTGSTDVVSFISDGTVLYGAFTNSNTATNIFYNPPAVSVSSWTNLSMTAGSTSALLPIVAPAGSRIVINAVGHWGGVNSESQVTLQAPNSAVIHNVRLRQAAATDKVGFALLATSALTQGWNGTAWVGCYAGTGGNISVVATIYLGMN